MGKKEKKETKSCRRVSRDGSSRAGVALVSNYAKSRRSRGFPSRFPERCRKESDRKVSPWRKLSLRETYFANVAEGLRRDAPVRRVRGRRRET